MKTPLTFTASGPVYGFAPGVKTGDIVDQLNARQIQLEALLAMTFGDTGEALRSLRVLEAQAGNPDLRPQQLDGEPPALWHARRALLVALDALVDAVVWSRHTCEVASELWVDVPVLVALVRSLSGRERAWIDEQLHERGVHQ